MLIIYSAMMFCCLILQWFSMDKMTGNLSGIVCNDDGIIFKDKHNYAYRKLKPLEIVQNTTITFQRTDTVYHLGTRQ